MYTDRRGRRIPLLVMALVVIPCGCNLAPSPTISTRILAQTHHISSPQSNFSLILATRPSDCPIEISEQMAKKAFRPLAILDVHIEQTRYRSSKLEDALPQLKAIACHVGADAVMDIRQWSLQLSDEAHLYHVRGLAIQYEKETNNNR